MRDIASIRRWRNELTITPEIEGGIHHAWSADVDALLREIDRLTSHSQRLNQAAWRLAEAFGQVPPGADRIESESIEAQVDRAVAAVAIVRELAEAEDREDVGGPLDAARQWVEGLR